MPCKMSLRGEPNLLSLSQAYDPDKTETALAALLAEKKQESDRSASLDTNADDTVDNLTAFLDQYEDLIKSQKEQALSVAQEVRIAVRENKQHESDNKALRDLLASDRVHRVAQDLMDLNLALEDTRAFLRLNGRLAPTPQ